MTDESRTLPESSTSSTRRVGFVGLGDQGAPMAMRLLEAGFETHLWARRAESLRPFIDTPARIAASLEDLADRCAMVCVCVVDDAGVAEVAGRLIRRMASGGLIVVHSTVRPQTCRALDAAGQARGIRVIDAPVSGGNAAAHRGELSLVVGADIASFRRCNELFAAYASHLLHLGEVGAGQSAKLINNALMAANLSLAHEAVSLGQQLGIGRDNLLAYLCSASGRSAALEGYGRMGSLTEFVHGARLLEKDLGLLRELAEASGASDLALSQPASRVIRQVKDAAGLV